MEQRADERDRDRAMKVSAPKDPSGPSLSEITDEGARDFCLPRAAGRFVEDGTFEELQRHPAEIRAPVDRSVEIMVGGSGGVLFRRRLPG